MASPKERLQRILAHRSTSFSILFYLIGLIWFCLLSQDELNDETYMSENALLVGQVVEKFSDVHAVSAYERQLSSLFSKGDRFALRRWLSTELTNIGLEVYEQNFTFRHNIFYPIEKVTGTNLYAIMRSPSGGRTEALLLSVPLTTECSQATSPCLSPTIGSLLSLMNLFRKQIYWAKDIVIVFVDSDYIGLLAWLEAYHGRGASDYLSWSELEGRSGNIQAGLNLEFSHPNPSSIDILPEGTNGFLANLDLVNTVVRLAYKHSIEPIVNGQSFLHERGTTDVRRADAQGLLKAVWTQASGSPSGLHGLLINYQIPAVTLRGPSRNYVSFSSSHESNRLGKLIEGVLRSLNNLQERLHQSFWYYLLPNPKRYISIGVYMPSVLALIGSLLVKLLGFWCAIADSAEKPDHKDVVHTLSDNVQNSPDIHSDSCQHVRKRIKSNEKADETKKQKNMFEAKEHTSGAKEDSIPPVLARLAVWLVLSFGCGLLLHSLPELLFYLYKRPEWERLQQFLNIQPLLSELLGFSMLGFFGFAMLVGPLLVAMCYRCFTDKVEAMQHLANSVVLIVWALFLTCMACLNVSASFLTSLLVVPILLMFIHFKAASVLFSSAFGLAWLMLSPPVLLILACCVHISFFEENIMTQAIRFDVPVLRELVSNVVVQSLLESNLFGSWGWSVLTLGYSSLWLLTWINLWCN